jgi:heme A synthase
MRATYRWLTAIIFALVVIQIGLAAYGAFDDIHKSESAPIAKKTTEDAFGAHAILGSVIVLLMIVLLILAAAGRMDTAKVRWAGILVGLGILQYILGVVSPSAPAVGFLHGVNALAIFAATGMLAHRTWTSEKAELSPAG